MEKNKRRQIPTSLILGLSVLLLVIVFRIATFLSAFTNPRPVSLVGSNAYLVAKDLAITVDGEEYGVGNDVILHTPVDLADESTSLEATWKDKGKEKSCLFILNIETMIGMLQR